MPQQNTGNALLNSAFNLWDFGTTSSIVTLPEHGYLANRWKVTRHGNGMGTVSKSSTPAGAYDAPKWMRNTAALSMNVTQVDRAAGTVTIAQTVENAFLWQRGIVTLLIVAAGPAGATFKVAYDSSVVGEITTQGKTSAGVDIFTTHEIRFMQGDSAAKDISVAIFTSPSQTGEYKISHAQLKFGGDPGDLAILPRTDAEERTLCQRYGYVAGGGSVGQGDGNQIIFNIAHPARMRKAPTFIPATTGNITIVDAATGATSVASANRLAWRVVSTTETNAVIAATGWQGQSRGQGMKVATGGSTVGALVADY